MTDLSNKENDEMVVENESPRGGKIKSTYQPYSKLY